MNRNRLILRLRNLLRMSEEDVQRAFELGGSALSPTEIQSLFELEPDSSLTCTDEHLGQFLDGLILVRRGPRPGGAKASAESDAPLTNNTVLKKLRIALELKEDNLLEIFERAGVTLKRHEAGSLFRKESHRNFRPCTDELLGSFLTGLTLWQLDPR